MFRGTGEVVRGAALDDATAAMVASSARYGDEGWAASRGEAAARLRNAEAQEAMQRLTVPGSVAGSRRDIAKAVETAIGDRQVNWEQLRAESEGRRP